MDWKDIKAEDLIGYDPTRRSLSIEEMHSLPPPSPQHLRDFAEHVCGAHSWYKHLPLLTGGQFAFFLARDSGAGYTPAHPRLHYTWKTTEEYRQRFGFLDYMYRHGPHDEFGRDAGPHLDLPPQIIDLTATTLFPYVSPDGNEACLWSIHAKAIDFLKSHPPRSTCDEDVLRWHSSEVELEALQLSDAEQELALSAIESESDLTSLPAAVAHYVNAHRRAVSIYSELQAREVTKIREALARLESFLHEKRQYPQYP